MATKRINMKQYNGSSYDTLLPNNYEIGDIVSSVGEAPDDTFILCNGEEIGSQYPILSSKILPDLSRPVYEAIPVTTGLIEGMAINGLEGVIIDGQYVYTSVNGTYVSHLLPSGTWKAVKYVNGNFYLIGYSGTNMIIAKIQLSPYSATVFTVGELLSSGLYSGFDMAYAGGNYYYLCLWAGTYSNQMYLFKGNAETGTVASNNMPAYNGNCQMVTYGNDMYLAMVGVSDAQKAQLRVYKNDFNTVKNWVEANISMAVALCVDASGITVFWARRTVDNDYGSEIISATSWSDNFSTKATFSGEFRSGTGIISLSGNYAFLNENSVVIYSKGFSLVAAPSITGVVNLQPSAVVSINNNIPYIYQGNKAYKMKSFLPMVSESNYYTYIKAEE